MDNYKYLAIETVQAEGNKLIANVVASGYDLKKVVSKTLRETGAAIDIYKKVEWRIEENFKRND